MLHTYMDERKTHHSKTHAGPLECAVARHEACPTITSVSHRLHIFIRHSVCARIGIRCLQSTLLKQMAMANHQTGVMPCARPNGAPSCSRW